MDASEPLWRGQPPWDRTSSFRMLGLSEVQSIAPKKGRVSGVLHLITRALEKSLREEHVSL